MSTYASIHSRIKEPLDNKWGGSTKQPPRDSDLSQQPASINAGGTLDMRSFEVKTDPNEATTSIEFLLTTLSSKMQLKTNQALALLANSSKFLIHVIIKGLKGDYRPVIEWYKEVFARCDFLMTLLENDTEGWTSTLQILDIAKAGLYSKHSDVAVWACRLLAKMANEMNSKNMSGMAWDWFVADNGGLQGILHCAAKNRELVGESVVSTLCQFGRYNLTELFTHHLKLAIPEAKDYMETVSGLIPPLAEYKASRDELANAGVLVFWIDFACRKADVDNSNSNERTAALGMLLEIWLNFPHVVEEKAEYADFILKLMQRANRDKNPNVQIVSLAQLFKLLEHFAMERNPYAPIVYKTLTFALVENHQKTSIRELILANFKEILENFNTIPVSILLDPFIKQIRTADGVTFSFNLFDFDFFTTVAKHPKLGIKNAIQTLDLLAKPYIYSVLYAPSAMSPFLIIANRFKTNRTFASFMQKLSKFGLDIYCGNLKKLRTKGKTDDRTFQLAQNERLMELLSKALSLGNDSLNEGVKQCVLEANAELRVLLGRDDERLLQILATFGDPEELLNEFEQEALAKEEEEEAGDESARSEEAPEPTHPKSGGNNKRRLERSEVIPEPSSAAAANSSKPPPNPQNKGRYSKPAPTEDELRVLEVVRSVAHSRIEKNAEESDLMMDRSALSDRELGKEDDFEKRVPYPKEYTLVPYKQLTLLEEKALLEIERVKQKKEERVQKKRIEENRKQIQETKKRKALKRQLDIRKVELNVATRNMKDIDQAMLLEEGVYEKTVQQNKKEPAIELRVIEDEEDRDYEALKLFVEQHKRVLRYLYNKYANSGFSSKNVASFDALKQKLDTISMAELIHMLKDHDITLRMLTHPELASFIRLINSKQIHRNDLTALTYDGFIELFIQLGNYIFSKDSDGRAHLPPVSHVEALLDHFRQSAKVRGENTVLYDNPDATALGDPELMRELTKFLETNPFYPLPEGYKKVEEKFLRENYVLPNYFEVPEPTKISVEILDSLLSETLGIHVLEPITTYEYKTKVVPTIGKLYQRNPAQKMFMMPLNKAPRKGVLQPVKRPVSLRQLNTEEIKPKLTATMKLEVAKARSTEKLVVKEVTEVIAEIIQAVEEGRDSIGNRMKWGPSMMLNQAVKDKLDKRRVFDGAKEDKEKQRKQRAVMIKGVLEDMKREKERRALEEAEQLKQQKEEEKRKLRKEKLMYEEKKRKILEEKRRREEEATQQQNEEHMRTELERREKAKEMKTFKHKKDVLFKRELQYIISSREKKEKDKAEKLRLQQARDQKHKKIVSERLVRDKEKREETKQQKLMLQEFMHRGDVITALVKHRKQLRHVFRFFSRMDDMEITHELSQEISTLDLSKFSKLCLQFRIVPQLIAAEEAVAIFRHAIKAKINSAKEQGKATSKETQYIEYNDFEELLIRIGLMVKDRLAAGGETVDTSAVLNKEYKVEGTTADVMENLLNYMNIRTDDTKITLDQKLNTLRLEASRKLPIPKRRKKSSNRNNVPTLSAPLKELEKPPEPMKVEDQANIEQNKQPEPMSQQQEPVPDPIQQQQQ